MRSRIVSFRVALLSLFALTGMASMATAETDFGKPVTLTGQVTSGGFGLAGYRVSLYANYIARGPSWRRLGTATTDRSGNFRIAYSLPAGLVTDNQPVLFVEAERGPAMLASAIGVGSKVPAGVVVNELTTVAVGNAFAQFVQRGRIDGNLYGMLNATRMAANLASPETGAAGVVLRSTPNGTETSTLATFNSLANVVAACVANESNCVKLFQAATPAGDPWPADVLQALANIVKHPSYPGYPNNADDPVFVLSQANPVFQPALKARPTNWLLFLKFTGGFYSAKAATNLLNGPGNPAIDEKGFVWVDNNFIPQPAGQFACAGNTLAKFDPSGQPAPGAPFKGGGLSGQGWGVAIDTRGTVWVANFGFQDPPCAFTPEAAPHNSISQFRPDGTPISPSQGHTQGNLSWPMGAVSDRRGNIWIASCGNDTLTIYPEGNPNWATNVPLGPTPEPSDPQIKPFGVAMDLAGNAWITGNRSNTVSVVSSEGKLIATLPGVFNGRTILSHPIGNAADSQGNIWVANSDWLDAPCPTRSALGTAANPSITMFRTNSRQPYPGSPFTGGGLTLPWGIAVDGDDTVWVFNFGVVPLGSTSPEAVGISRFCGVDTARCPAGSRVGDPISPSTGYRSDALMRITAGQFDPSGNIWLMNNWTIDADPFKNPGGNAVVIAVGAAAPIRTPLIGPPVSFRPNWNGGGPPRR